MSFLSGIFGQNGYQAQIAPQTNASTLAEANQAQGQVQGGLNQQQALVNALAGQNGIGNQSSVFNQLQGVANGTGPNPAQAALNNATGQNVANQAALMAGQRGGSANAGLLARQAAQQGAATQQNAVGQGAAMQANQSLNALNQLGGIAGQQVAQQQGALNSYNSDAQNNQGQVLNSIASQNSNATQAQGNVNNVQSQIAQNNANAAGKAAGGLFGGLGSALTGGLFAQGGVVPAAPNGPRSKVGMFCSGGMSMKSGGHVPGKAMVKGNSFKNDTVKAMLSPGEIVIPRSVLQSPDPINNAAKFVAAIMAKHGKK